MTFPRLENSFSKSPSDSRQEREPETSQRRAAMQRALQGERCAPSDRLTVPRLVILIAPCCAAAPLPMLDGVKVSIMLEEIGLSYEAHLVDFNSDDQQTPEFPSLNPNIRF